MAPGSSWGFSSVHGQPAVVCSLAPAKAGALEVVARAHAGPFRSSLCGQQQCCPKACPLDSGGQHPASAWTRFPGPGSAGCAGLAPLQLPVCAGSSPGQGGGFPHSENLSFFQLLQGYRSHSAAFFLPFHPACHLKIIPVLSGV